MNTTSLIPRGVLSNAEIKAMCSFPFPDAIDKLTSRPENFPFSFSKRFCFISVKGFDVSIVIVSAFFEGVKSGEVLDFTSIIFSQSPRLIRPVTWPQVSLSDPRKATSSILKNEGVSL